MKATINGITYEGTVDEITTLVDHITVKIEQQPNVNPTGWRKPSIIDSISSTGKYTCSNTQCNCTGACTRPQGVSVLEKSLDIIDCYSKNTHF